MTALAGRLPKNLTNEGRSLDVFFRAIRGQPQPEIYPGTSGYIRLHPGIKK